MNYGAATEGHTMKAFEIMFFKGLLMLLESLLYNVKWKKSK